MSSPDSSTAAHRGFRPAQRSQAVPPAHVALLDRDGVIVSVNRAWRHFGLANGGSATTGLGSNYLDVCMRASAGGEPIAETVAKLIRAALDGIETGSRVVYPCGLGKDQRWFSVYAIPLPGRHRGALVVHVDVTRETVLDVGI